MYHNFILKGAAVVSLLSISTSYIENRISEVDTEIEEPVDTVSIIMPSLNEERFIEQAVSSIRNQNIISQYPDKFEFILADSGSKDNTIKIAKQYVDRILNLPKGKLTARNLATDYSFNNIIVAVDADAYYPDGWLNTLLKPFQQSNVVAVHGSNVDYNVPKMPGKLFTTLHPLYIKLISPYEMNGGNSAYYKHAFYLTGKFNENTNQLNASAMSNEEERAFGLRLSKLGKVVYKINAPKIHLGGEKVQCRHGNGNKEICNNYGFSIERFDKSI